MIKLDYYQTTTMSKLDVLKLNELGLTDCSYGNDSSASMRTDDGAELSQDGICLWINPDNVNQREYDADYKYCLTAPSIEGVFLSNDFNNVVKKIKELL